MDIDEILRVVGALYLGLYLRAEIMQRENTELKAEIESLKKANEPPTDEERRGDV